MLGIGRGESYVIKQSGLRIQRDHTLDIESVLLANAVKGRVLIKERKKSSLPEMLRDLRVHGLFPPGRDLPQPPGDL
jgi:hypothetical protein